jgi:hypothetical protein
MSEPDLPDQVVTNRTFWTTEAAAISRVAAAERGRPILAYHRGRLQRGACTAASESCH